MPLPPPPDERRCTATTATGERCTLWAIRGKATCYGHDPDEQCTAHISGGTTDQHRAGERCHNRHAPGLTVCEYHGGSARQAKKAGVQRVADQNMRALLETYGLPIETSPEAAILAEVHRTAGHVAWLEAQVHALTVGELTWGVTRVKEGGDDRGTTEEAVPHALLKLYNEERDRLVRVCTAALKAGVEERRVKLAEQQGALVADLIRTILRDLDLTSEQQAKAADVVPFRLRALAG